MGICTCQVDIQRGNIDKGENKLARRAKHFKLPIFLVEDCVRQQALFNHTIAICLNKWVMRRLGLRYQAILCPQEVLN